MTFCYPGMKVLTAKKIRLHSPIRIPQSDLKNIPLEFPLSILEFFV